MEYNYQTLEQFVTNPFEMGYQPSLQEYARKYNDLNKRKMIKFGGALILDGVYFLRIRIASESTADIWYDVVVQFFTDDDLKGRNLALNSYYVKFFSNSPGFVYKYGYLYHQYDMLVEILADKYPKEVLTKEPLRTNAERKMGYDKSIYYACRYILDHPMTYLSKTGLSVIQVRNAKTFFSGIKDFESVSDDISISKMEASIKKEVRKDQKAIREKKREKREETVETLKSIFVKPKKKATTSTAKNKTPKKSSVKTKKPAVAKKASRHTTVKKSKPEK